MKVLMIGTSTCSKCKRIAPIIEEYCRSHNIVYRYEDFSNISAEMMNTLSSKGIKQAPVFFIYKKEGEYPIVVSGDDVFLELESV